MTEERRRDRNSDNKGDGFFLDIAQNISKDLVTLKKAATHLLRHLGQLRKKQTPRESLLEMKQNRSD